MNSRTNSVAVTQVKNVRSTRNKALEQLQTRATNENSAELASPANFTQEVTISHAHQKQVDRNEARQQKIHQESQRSFDMNARLAERMSQLPKLTTTS